MASPSSSVSSARISASPATTSTDPQHAAMANALRALAMDAVQQANSGHPGMPMGMADVATVLFRDILVFDPENPTWPDRDRFILSAGHGSMLLYALLHLTGYRNMTLDQIRNFRQLHSLTPGHPEVMPDCGIETTTGPLGQGIATAVGFALAERMAAARFGEDLVNHHTYVIASDGDLMEGISHESASLAGHLGLGRLIVLYDDNGISIDGPTDLSFTDDTRKRFEAYGWGTWNADGHDPQSITAALHAARADRGRPSLICCKTTIGFGAPTKAGTSASHGAPLGAEEIKGAKDALGWPHAPFVIPDEVKAQWQAAGARGRKARHDWEARLAAAPEDLRARFLSALAGDAADRVAQVILAFKKETAAAAPKLATRAASGKVLEALAPALPELVGGSADLTGSNLTLTAGMKAIDAGDFSGSYVYYGVREHAMAAAMNGLALHGGFIPYGGTFLSFADYCRPAIRLAALMKQRVVYVMTHDSIGLGEDGPTHQPVEHLAALRCIPNLRVLRPADAIETAECWQIALDRRNGPSLLALTRQGLPTLPRSLPLEDNASSRGAYLLADSGAAADVTLWASGSEVEIALAAREILAQKDIATRVISVPSLDLFLAQDEGYRHHLRGQGSLHIAVEAAVRQGWDAVIGPDGIFVGMSGFGESAPYETLYAHFGITAEAIAQKAEKALRG